MSMRREFEEFCIGTVTIITSDSLVLTGQIQRNNDEEFIIIKLTAPLLIIPGNAGPAPVQPFYAVGDNVQVNEDQIVTIGPSHV